MHKTALLITILAIAMLASGCVQQTANDSTADEAPDEFRHSEEEYIYPCGEVPWEWEDKIIEQRWSDNTLYAKAVIATVCGAIDRDGNSVALISDHEIEGNTIELGWTYDGEYDALTACQCTSKFSYKVGPLEHSDYEVVIE